MGDRSRGWLLTLPAEEYSKEAIEAALEPYSAYIGQLEKGEHTNYLHWQIYLEHREAIRFSTLKRLFPRGHLEARKGTKAQAVAYVTKSETSQGVAIQKGEIRTEDERGRRTDLERLRERILKEGASARSLILEDPSALRYSKKLIELEEIRNEQTWGRTEREVKARYLWGPPGAGKTRMLFERYGHGQVYRVTDYAHPFDRYDGEPVLALDEFDEGVSFDLLLNLLDRYPLQLPARYVNRWAAFTEVWVIANVPLRRQYRKVQREEPERWEALLRRFAEQWEWSALVAGEQRGAEAEMDLW